MEIIITAGGTSENIDAVRTITNSATGSLGALISSTLKEKFPDVKIHYLAPKEAVNPKVEVDRIYTTNVKSVSDALRTLLLNRKIDYVIHSMAISDYTVSDVFDASGNRLDNSTKLSSDYDQLTVLLIKTPKLINMIKNVSPKTRLIGFKLLNQVNEEQLVEAAKKQIANAHSDYVVANDSAQINGDIHKAIIVDADGNIVGRNDGTKTDLARLIVGLIER